MNGLKEVTLSTLNQGAAEELFNHELGKVIKNIEDPNTKATETRKITLELSFIPTRDRDGGVIKLAAKTKLAGVQGVESTFAQSGGKMLEHDLIQPPLMTDNISRIGG
jgi:hypothetical protein